MAKVEVESSLMIQKFKIEASATTKEAVIEELQDVVASVISKNNSPGEWECTQDVVVLNKKGTGYDGRMVMLFHPGPTNS